MSFKQNIIIDTKDGKVKLISEKCIECDYHKFCYIDDYGDYHKETPRGVTQDCIGE